MVRRGLAEHAVGRMIVKVDVCHPRSIRRHLPGAADFAGRLANRLLADASRRGKYLWLTLGGAMTGDAILAQPSR